MAATVDEIIHDPIGWGQIRLAGGWKKLVAATTGYAFVSLLLHVIIYRLLREEISATRFADGALQVNLFITAIIIFFVGTAAVKKAVLRDYTTEMIQSHRRTTMSGPTACMGYLIGPLTQVMMTTFVNFIACSILATMGSTPLNQSYLGTAALFGILIVMGLLWWSFALLIALCTRGKLSVAPLIVFVFISTNTKLVYVIPGLAMLFGATIATELLDKTNLDTQAWWLMFSLFAQVGFSLAFFIASSRKYHRDDLPAFSPLLALTIATMSGLVAGVGLRFWRPNAFSIFVADFQTNPRNWMFATFLILTLVMFLPVASTALHHSEWARRTALDKLFRAPRPIGFITGSILACLLSFGILTVVSWQDWSRLLCVPDGAWRHAAERTGVALLASFLSLITLGGILRFVYATSPKAIWVIVLFIVATWALPPFVDASIDAMREVDIDGPRSILFASSPVGSWLWAFHDVESPVRMGLVVQGILAISAVVLSRRAKY